MALARPIEPIDVDDDTIRSALEDSDVPALLPALAHITGDLSLLREDLRIDPARMIEDQGGLSEEQIAAVRAARPRGPDPLPGRRQRVRTAARPATTCAASSSTWPAACRSTTTSR